MVNESRIIMFDWDDTLFSTTFLQKSEITDNIIKELSSLENMVENILNFSKKYGFVYIISNSQEGWVHNCCKKFFPRIFQLLKDITIISSRDKYERAYPNNGFMWKYLTLKNLENQEHSEIISIGDSMSEYLAVKKFCEEKGTVFKLVKFAIKPDIRVLREQLAVINCGLENLCNHKGNLELKTEIHYNK
jgi:hypothetical protein